MKNEWQSTPKSNILLPDGYELANPYTKEDMNDYNRGKRDIMLEMAKEDLINVASRIAVLENDLDGARKTKWELVNKIRLLENNAAFECVEKGEALTLHEKINIIKEGFAV
tara:strand:+ start:2386 stop:2718 length:333 start_codon:yes stop_codon:yes gene_type:complete